VLWYFHYPLRGASDAIYVAGDEEALSIWRTYRDLSLKKYEQEYKTLNVSFDVYWGESKVGKPWQDKCVMRGEELGVVETVEGAKLINLEEWKLGKAILRKRGILVTQLVSVTCQAVNISCRWHIDLFDTRHRGRHRAVRGVQVRQNDLRG
jgi:tRNA synthetases class I (R)